MANNRMKNAILGTMVTALALALCGCSVNIGPDENRYEEPAPGEASGGYILGSGMASADVENLNIDWEAGDVTIVYGDVDEIQFEEMAKKELKPDAQMRYKEENGTLYINFCADSMVGINNVPEKDLTITLPEGYVMEHVEMNVVSTEVSLPEGFTANKIEVDTVSGNILSAGKVSLADVEVNAVSGDVTLEVNDLESFVLGAVSGNAQLILPTDTEFTAEIDTVSGDFSTDFETRKEGDSYIHGSGETTIKMESVSGNLEILMK